MLPFLGSDSRYSLTAEEVRQLPLGRRIGVISISPREVALAFLGRDAAWTGGVTLVVGETIHRGGLTLTLTGIGKNRLGRPTAELEVIACPAAVKPGSSTSASSATSASAFSPATADEAAYDLASPDPKV